MRAPGVSRDRGRRERAYAGKGATALRSKRWQMVTVLSPLALSLILLGCPKRPEVAGGAGGTGTQVGAGGAGAATGGAGAATGGAGAVTGGAGSGGTGAQAGAGAAGAGSAGTGTQAGGGAPSGGAGGAGSAAGGQGTAVAGGTGTAIPALASPQEFTPSKDLRTIHFSFDKSDIRPQDARILDDNAKWLKGSPATKILIEGHCDDRGTIEYNLALG